jgi:hypothetical protein
LEIARRKDLLPFIGDLPTFDDLVDRFQGRLPNTEVLAEPVILDI